MEYRPYIKNGHSGRVPRDGMTGGDYAFCTALAYKNLGMWPALRCLEARADYDEICDWFLENYDEDGDVRVEAYITFGYDHSVGINSYSELDEVFDPEDFYEAVDNCPYLNDEENFYIHNHMQEMVENLECGDFKFYEIDD
jgi:hypothetical protein